MFSKPPRCEDHSKCRFVSHGGMQMLENYLPTYDRSGKRLQLGEACFKEHWSCGTCGKSWVEEHSKGASRSNG